MQDDGLEDLLDGFAQRSRYVGCAEVGLVHLVRHQFVGNLLLVEQARRVGLVDFLRHQTMLFTTSITFSPISAAASGVWASL